MIKTHLASLALLLSLAGVAAAQDAGGDPFGKAMEGAPPSGVRSGELRVPESPPPGQSPFAQPAPAAAPSGVAPVAQGSPAGPAGGGAEETDSSAEINQNYDATMGIYSKILDAQGYETGNLEKRIASNEEIVTRYKPELVKCEDELRKMQVEWMNSAFQLRRRKEAGALSDDGFQKAVALEEAKYTRKRSAVAGDVQFYREEIANAEKRLGEMRANKRSVEEKAAHDGKLKPKPVPRSVALYDEMNARLDRLGPFAPRLPMDNAIFDVGRVGQAKPAAPSLDAAPADGPGAQQGAAPAPAPQEDAPPPRRRVVD